MDKLVLECLTISAVVVVATSQVKAKEVSKVCHLNNKEEIIPAAQEDSHLVATGSRSKIKEVNRTKEVQIIMA